MKARWLHISDFHFAGGDPYDRNVVLNALVASLRRFQKHGHGADLVFATGDIAQKGQASEYAAATGFFDAVLKELGLGRERLFVVPGNHDVDRRQGSRLLRTLATREDADEHFAQDIGNPHITLKQNAFLTWYNGYFEGIRRFPERTTCGPVEAVDLPGGRVGVLPINSALFCQDEKDHAKLWVGRRCLDDGIRALAGLTPKPALTVALLHHPLTWLHPVEQSNIKAILQRDVDVVLRGHMHESDVDDVAGVAGRALHIAAGATFQSRRWPNRAFFAKVEDGQLELFPIRYEDSPQERWTVDPSLFPDPPYVGTFPVVRLAPLLSARTSSPSEQSPATSFVECGDGTLQSVDKIIPTSLNRFPGCAELSIDSGMQGTSSDSFIVLLELRFGRGELKKEGMTLKYSINESELITNLENCIIDGERLGDSPRSEDFVPEPDGRWRIRGPLDRQGTLSGGVILHEVLCRIRSLSDLVMPNISVSLLSHRSYFQYTILDGTSDNPLVISRNKEAIISMFLNKCLLDDGGWVELSRSSIKWRK